MLKELIVTLSQTSAYGPIVTWRNPPGSDAEFTPAQLRSLAAALKKAAADSEAQPFDAKHYRPVERIYPLTVKRSLTKGRAD